MAFGFASLKEEYKLVVLVRTDLDMGKGKMAAQVGHASVECALWSEKKDKRAFDAWMASGQKKVVLKVPGKDEMVRRMTQAKSCGIHASLIVDAGRTQIEPGSETCVGLGPAPESELNKITGDLKMLRRRTTLESPPVTTSTTKPWMRRSFGTRGCSRIALQVAWTSSSLVSKPDSQRSRSASASSLSISSDGIPRDFMCAVIDSALIFWAPQSVCPITMTSSTSSSYTAMSRARIVSP